MNPDEEKNLAIELFNRCWELMDLNVRTPKEDAEMLHLAHASRWHWGNVATSEQLAIGEWQCAKAYALIGNGKAALAHALLSNEYAGEISDPHFTKASACEALAHAHFLLGDLKGAQEFKDSGFKLLEGLAPDDAEHIRAQLNALPF